MVRGRGGAGPGHRAWPAWPGARRTETSVGPVRGLQPPARHRLLRAPRPGGRRGPPARGAGLGAGDLRPPHLHRRSRGRARATGSLRQPRCGAPAADRTPAGGRRPAPGPRRGGPRSRSARRWQSGGASVPAPRCGPARSRARPISTTSRPRGSVVRLPRHGRGAPAGRSGADGGRPGRLRLGRGDDLSDTRRSGGAPSRGGFPSSASRRPCWSTWPTHPARPVASSGAVTGRERRRAARRR